jgi:hypothetical protein
MIKAGLSPTRLRRKVLALCAEANYVGDLISELAHEARDQQQALLLAGQRTESPSKRLAPRSSATSCSGRDRGLSRRSGINLSVNFRTCSDQGQRRGARMTVTE